jgi:glutaryl-CoA dehydrogenase
MRANSGSSSNLGWLGLAIFTIVVGVFVLPEGAGSEPFAALQVDVTGVAGATSGIASAFFSYGKVVLKYAVSLTSFQLVQARLAQMSKDIALGQQAVLHVARLKESGNLAVEMILMLKRNNCMKAIQIARDAR